MNHYKGIDKNSCNGLKSYMDFLEKDHSDIENYILYNYGSSMHSSYIDQYIDQNNYPENTPISVISISSFPEELKHLVTFEKDGIVSLQTVKFSGSPEDEDYFDEECECRIVIPNENYPQIEDLGFETILSPLGEILGVLNTSERGIKYIHLFFDPIRYSGSDISKIVILDYTFNTAFNKLFPERFDTVTYTSPNTVSTESQVEGLMNVIYKAAQSCYDDSVDKIKELKESLIYHLRKKKEASTVLVDKDSVKERMISELKDINNNRSVEWAMIKDDKFKFRVNDVKVEKPEKGARYLLGDIIISVRMKDGKVYMHPAKGNISKGLLEHDVVHPHVFQSEKDVCLGNIESLIPDLCVSGDLSGLVTVLKAFAEATDLTDTIGRRLVDWEFEEI